jgi:ATPase family associated with various cellular activities (AAA)
MPTEQPEGFANNWDYLKAELRWLDQVLMMAVTRQRKETHEVERVAQTRADRVTSHWWKGLVALGGEGMYDEHRPPSSGAKVSYQQQLETKIQSSHRRGVKLALPHLRDRLNLSTFEKNLVLMSLAPEMNRRYARLYRYLQGDETCKTDLPTVDLVLRLLCRNDGEWRTARMQLSAASPLIRHEFLQMTGSMDTFLNRPLRLAEPLIRYLLADQPTDQTLELLLHSSSPSVRPVLLDQTVDPVQWSEVVLPEPVLTSLQYLVQRVEGYELAEERWGFDGSNAAVYQPGAIALLVGNPGTGKSLASGAIAHALDTPLYVVDLAKIEPSDYLRLLEEIQTQDPTVLLVKSAQRWFGRSTPLSSAALHQFLSQRRSLPGVTVLSAERRAAMPMPWQKQMDQVLVLPMPGVGDRLQIWRQAFAAAVPLAADLDWERLAMVKLSGGEIGAIAHEAVLYAAASEASKVGMSHVLHVLGQRGKGI